MSINSLLTNQPILNAIAKYTALNKVSSGQVVTLAGVPAATFNLVAGAAMASVTGATITLTNVPVGAAINISYSSDVIIGATSTITEQLLITDGAVVTAAASNIIGNNAIGATNAVVNGTFVYIATTPTVNIVVQAQSSGAGSSVTALRTEFSAFVI